MVKPYTVDQLKNIVKKCKSKSINKKFQELIKENFLTQDKSIISQLKGLESELTSNKSVMIEGPPGVGKQIIAKVIHMATHDNDSSFVHLRCGTLTEKNIDTELFGSLKGFSRRAKEKNRKAHRC